MADLPINTSRNERDQNFQILQIAEDLGWLTYNAMTVAPKRGQPDRYTVTLPNGRVLELEGQEVKPWVFGLACAHGLPERVVYRPELLG